ncbi:MAG: hypothetical protein EXS06_11255 [Planctomycetaceae bacterium]|nr:hypothetical protein [Planctomycetaceae bacterium]
MPMPHAVDRPQPGLQGLQGLQGLAGSAPGGASIRRGRLGAVAIGILLASLAGGGCRSGVRSMSAPKWPSFGASKPKGIDDTALTAAPKIDAPTTKPSAAATPYPTTSTPAGYVVNEASPTAGVAAVGIQTPATDPATVTYGVAPPPQLAAAAVDPRSAPTPENAPPQSISPQVGPYATLPTPPPPAETPAVPGLPPSSLPLEPVPPPPAQVAGTPPGGGYPLAPPATPSSFPSTAGYEPSRVADARGSLAAEPAAPGYAAAGAAAASTLSPINPPESGTQARYASDRSRFGDPGADPALTAPVGAFPASPPADAGWSGSAGLPAAAPAAAPPPGPFPAANPDGLTSPPVRRPDPVFRPGGTSSYRPAEQIFVDEQPVAPSAVRTASYETLLPPPPARQD